MISEDIEHMTDGQEAPESADGAPDVAAGEAGETPEEKPKKTFRERVIEDLPYILILLLVLCIRLFALLNVTVPTGSMRNTLTEGTRAMGLTVIYKFQEPERGDIIVFHAPDNPSTLYVKRIVGLPGETVEIVGGKTYINGEYFEEEYLAETPEYKDFGPYNVPDGAYFVMGDNRNHSLDARLWDNTYVYKSAILGKVYFAYWPWIRWLY